MDLDSGAGLLHRLTSYVPDRDWDQVVDDNDPRVRQDFTSMDPDTRPPQFKEYADGLDEISLPRVWAESESPATALLAGVPVTAGALDRTQLGRILFLGAGVVRTATRWEQPYFYRAAGSAGSRFPLELYVSTRAVEGVQDGVYWYDAQRHVLVRVGPAALGETTTLVVTGVPWRTGWKYAERGWRHLYWDAGTALSQLIAAAAGYAPALRTVFPDAAVTRLVGADGVDEFPLALLTLGAGTPAIEPTGPAVTGSLPHNEFSLCTTAQRAGDGDELGAAWAFPEVFSEAAVRSAAEGSLDAVIRRRGSQRRMDPAGRLPRAQLEYAMTVALRGIDIPHWVAVHAVDGVEPGLYRWPDLAAPIHRGDLRAELERVCLGQGLAADCAYVVIAAAPLSILDDRSYRSAQVAAGIVEGRLHLVAYAMDAGATGMTFIDSEVPALIGESDVAGLLFTCVGVPAYANRAGGRPGEPVTVTPVTTRIAH
ncbi:nitroreductase family protein [Hamadaea tsunoensis]|uniref:hypothetical protein n=1 Tax=Hamadaea tsunoensis TaxID=53368 RepID=UPI00040D8E9A|nr:hypothetical protein [Hamadaea tsunoensis]